MFFMMLYGYISQAKMKIISVLINIFPVDLDDLENRATIEDNLVR